MNFDKILYDHPYSISISLTRSDQNFNYIINSEKIEAIQRPFQLYNICSISKLVASIICLISVNENKFKLDDKVRSISNLKYDFTVRSLLNHTSGINTKEDSSIIYYNIKNYNRINYIDLISISESQIFNYNSYNYFIIKDLIEEVYSLDFNNVIQQIFDKYGLQNPPLFLSNDCINIQKPFSIKESAFLDYNLTELSIQRSLSGGLFSSCLDLHSFLFLFFSNKFKLKENLFIQMTTFINDLYGLGVFKYTILDNEYWGHHGNSFGYCSQFLINIKTKDCCTILANTDSTEILNSILETIFKYEPI
jgi:CubicO group peptidase (beta-lactamase class C family)